MPLPPVPTTPEPPLLLLLPAVETPDFPAVGAVPEPAALDEGPLPPPAVLLGASLPQPARPAATVRPTRASEVGIKRTGAPELRCESWETTAPEVDEEYIQDCNDVRPNQARSHHVCAITRARTPNKPGLLVNLNRDWKRSHNGKLCARCCHRLAALRYWCARFSRDRGDDARERTPSLPSLPSPPALPANPNRDWKQCDNRSLRHCRCHSQAALRYRRRRSR